MVEVSHVTKRYGSHVAVDDLSFTIGRGQTYGFLGPNGAGKSTTMNIMTGCLAASEGEVRIGGYDIFEQAREAKRLIGYLPELPPLYPDSTPREYLRFVGAAKGIPPRELSAAADAAMKLTDINFVFHRSTEGYKEVELIFYAYDSTDCLVSLNGEARLTVSRSSVENIINDISNLITSGGEQPAEE